MATKKTAATQPTKAKNNKTENSPNSTSSEPTANLKTPQDILALGQEIVQQLNLQKRGDVLARWMAHHLAYLIAESAQAVGPAKVAAEKRAVDLILKLWLHRRALPEPVDPLGTLRPAIAVLGRLMPNQNPWPFYPRPSATLEHILQDIFQNMANVMLAGIELTQHTQTRSLTKAEANMLEAEEIQLLAMLEKWKECIVPESTFENPFQQLISGKEPQTPSADDDLVGNAKNRAEILTQLGEMHANLGTLLTRFKSTPIAETESEAPDN